MSADGIVDRIFRGVVAQELLVRSRAPPGVFAVFLREHDDTGLASLGQERRRSTAVASRSRARSFRTSAARAVALLTWSVRGTV